MKSLGSPRKGRDIRVPCELRMRAAAGEDSPVDPLSTFQGDVAAPVHLDRDGRQWRARRSPDHLRVMRRVEDRAMAGADDLLLRRVVLHRAARMRADRAVGYDATVCQADQ